MTNEETTPFAEFKRIRRHLHAHPELSGKEYQTADYVADYLARNTSAQVHRLAETAVLAVFEGGEAGPATLLRADMDALPILETNTFPHCSKVEGVSHKCGHDGHTAMLLGVSKGLSQNRLRRGRVLLLFQPSEENGKGAAMVLEDPLMADFEIDRVFALHNLPGFPKGRIFLRPGAFTAKVKSLVVELRGKTAHAAEPEQGQNPALAMAALLQKADALVCNKAERPDFFLITPVHAVLGEEAYGVSAGLGRLHFTLRAWSPAVFDEKANAFLSEVAEQAGRYGLAHSHRWLEAFETNHNDAAAVEILRQAADAAQLPTTDLSTPFRWGEDFGLFTQRYAGAMFGLGAGEDTPALHNPDYDFPDDILAAGIRIFMETLNIIHDTADAHHED